MLVSKGKSRRSESGRLQGSSYTRDLMEGGGCCGQELVLTAEGWSLWGQRHVIPVAQLLPGELSVWGLIQS